MKKNILVTGANGQLGSEIKVLSEDYPEYKFYFTGRKELDITNQEGIRSYVEENSINTIINCAAYTAVDRAESEPELADQINHLAVKYLAEATKEAKAQLIHISTDYVFDGKGYRPYPTDHPTSPVNMYGKTKLAGEEALKNINPNASMIIRTSWVYSSFGNNFVKSMLKLGEKRDELNVVNDQIGAPTYAKDLAGFILKHGIDASHSGCNVYHYSNEGVCSWYDFAKEIMVLGKRKCEIKPIPSAAYPTPAQRPFYSLLDKESLKKDFQVEVPYWRKGLKECMDFLQSKANSQVRIIK